MNDSLGNGDGGNSTNQANFGQAGGIGAVSTIRNTARHLDGGGGGSGGTGNTDSFIQAVKVVLKVVVWKKWGKQVSRYQRNKHRWWWRCQHRWEIKQHYKQQVDGGSGVVVVKEKDKANGVFNMNVQYNSNKTGKWAFTIRL